MAHPSLRSPADTSDLSCRTSCVCSLLCLLIMVGTVFAVGPAGLIVTPVQEQRACPDLLTTTLFWLIIILVYYFIATFISIDAIIGKI